MEDCIQRVLRLFGVLHFERKTAGIRRQPFLKKSPPDSAANVFDVSYMAHVPLAVLVDRIKQYLENDSFVYETQVSLLGMASSISRQHEMFEACIFLLTQSMARHQSEAYPLVGDVHRDETLNCSCVTLTPPYDEDAVNLELLKQLHGFNSGPGLLEGALVRGSLFILRRGMDELPSVLEPFRMDAARDVVLTLLREHNPFQEEYRALIPHVDSLVVGAYERRKTEHEVTPPAPARVSPLQLQVGKVVGKCRGGILRGNCTAQRFTECPPTAVVQTIIESLALPFSGFQQHRDPEKLSSGGFRFVLSHVPECCPLCQVRHSSSGNVQYVVWTPKARALYYKCFDSEARDWYRRL